MEKLQFNYDLNSVIKDLNKVRKEPLLSEIEVTLDNLNDCKNYLKEKNNCANCTRLDDCKNMHYGHKHIIKDNEFVLVKCEYMQNKILKQNSSKYIKTLYLPDNILNASLSDFYLNTENRKKALKAASYFISNYSYNNFLPGLLLEGKFSSGKTYLLASICNELSKRDIKTLLIYFPDLVFEIKNSFNNPEKLSELVNMLKEVDVLMIDDFGSENITPWFRDEILSSIINYRFQSNKPIFVSTNLNSEAIIRHLTINQGDDIKAMRIVQKLYKLCTKVML